MKDIISLSELHKSKRIYWIKSFLTLTKWIKRDMKTNNILDTKTIQSNNGYTGLRYYIQTKNIDLFIDAFKSGTIFKK